MTCILLAFYMFWAGAAGEYLSAKYPNSSTAWVLFWCLLWPLRLLVLLFKVTYGAAK